MSCHVTSSLAFIDCAKSEYAFFFMPASRDGRNSLCSCRLCIAPDESAITRCNRRDSSLGCCWCMVLPAKGERKSVVIILVGLEEEEWVRRVIVAERRKQFMDVGMNCSRSQ